MLTGKLQMTTPVHEIVPELRDVVASSMHVQHLAVHTSGLPYDFPYRMTRPAREEDRDPWAKFSRTDLYDYLRSVKTDAPGKKWRYSNIGYAVLGIALEHAYGGRYPDILRTEVLDPLQMSDTISSTEPVECATHGHCGSKPSPWSESALLYGPGDVRSSVHDMLLYMDAAMLADSAPYPHFGKYLFAPFDADKPLRVQQGLGWGLVEEDNSWLVMASGATYGFSCTSMLHPAKRKAVIVLSNHVDIAGFGDLLRAWIRKSSTIQGATQLLYDAL